MTNMLRDCTEKIRVILTEALSAFRRNNDLTAASSLAFAAMLALIPTLFLLTSLLSMVIGSSAQALARTEELLTEMLPAYSQNIVKEVRIIASHKGAIGLINIVVLFWTMTPFVSHMRFMLGTIFKQKPGRHFFLRKLFDVFISMVFLVGVTAVMVAGMALKVLEKEITFRLLPHYIESNASFPVVTAVIFLFYFIFSSGILKRDLLSGALVAALIWFAMRPAFHIFLAYNPGYGYAFGSFKSLFVVIIWIYASLAVFLFGAEVVESLHKKRGSLSKS